MLINCVIVFISEPNYSPVNVFSPGSSHHYIPPNFQLPPSTSFGTLQPQPSVSPHERSPTATPMYPFQNNPVQCPSPVYSNTSSNTFTTQGGGMNSQQRPPNTYLPQINFNIRSQMQANIPPDSNVPVLLNMDTQQNIDMTRVPMFSNDVALESGDTNNLSFSFLDNNLSENLSGQLRLCDLEPAQNTNRGNDENMSTDSISRLAINAYEEIVEGQ